LKKFTKVRVEELSSDEHKKCSHFREILVGLASENFPRSGSRIGSLPNSYAFDNSADCYIAGKIHNTGVRTLLWNCRVDVIGCGLMQSHAKELSIFFTLNGMLLGQFLCDSSF
jgi:hypothetical protein